MSANAVYSILVVGFGCGLALATFVFFLCATRRLPTAHVEMVEEETQ